MFDLFTCVIDIQYTNLAPTGSNGDVKVLSENRAGKSLKHFLLNKTGLFPLLLKCIRAMHCKVRSRLLQKHFRLSLRVLPS